MKKDYLEKLQDILNQVIESKMADLLLEGEEILLELENDQIIVSRKNGILHVRYPPH